ncbi:MAG TPA: hypothetical protein DEE98_08300 [Elusimicrobia bacterium]|nr:MAG: hypothetical protein A2278_09105 [Elusimicrobia bacterium RIFOXYA12_FULL_49_49]OGS09398.1 MAG: hypothetical protein A2204_04655 [Elusimicrobia bacterium RIFOXYA1_FULL_47_7]OGS11173.1 MAG: hypothetical protein A2386_02690 [Elusimicrobia bacterium RIFOXYB1_FULL_48_9]OGS14941.1 MAG: hypothetical protein A2251_07960 [Elusimicrobia bacterium RIFOXYA2_FULL_47_53]OGS26124.1 MAG: hypothetical protein A2339_02315 [Elusimicrobia bacterium RIFOXYB12_FULL_50_12]OGS29286.1 MAG: hypothetical protein
MKKFNILPLLVLFSLFVSGCTRPPRDNTINIIGSDTMVNLVQSWAEEFMKSHPDYFIAVTGGGSGTGMANLISGSCDIASASRKIKPREIELAAQNGITQHEFIVGLDGIAVVVNPGNPVNELTIDQLADIFTGKLTNWKDVGGKDGKIVILSREVNSGTHIYFKERVLNKGKSGASGGKEFAPSALMLSSSQAIADEISGNENAIGYYGMGYINPKQKPLKVAKDPKTGYFSPDIPSVVSGKYPISRPMFLYTKNEPNRCAREFLEFAMSKRGQEIVKETDFVPVK